MSLNLKENGDAENKTSKRGEPILHKPKENIPGPSKKILWTLVGIAVLAGAAVLLYKSGYMKIKNQSSKETVFTQQRDTSKTAVAASSVDRQINETVGESGHEKQMESDRPQRGVKPSRARPNQSEANAGEKPVVPSAATGQFTIYIGTYKSKSVADEESGRWNEAGYQSFVNEPSGSKGNVYRVCLGHYKSKSDAREQAEKLRDAFEGGYWVDVVK